MFAYVEIHSEYIKMAKSQVGQATHFAHKNLTIWGTYLLKHVWQLIKIYCLKSVNLCLEHTDIWNKR